MIVIAFLLFTFCADKLLVIVFKMSQFTEHTRICKPHTSTLALHRCTASFVSLPRGGACCFCRSCRFRCFRYCWLRWWSFCCTFRSAPGQIYEYCKGAEGSGACSTVDDSGDGEMCLETRMVVPVMVIVVVFWHLFDRFRAVVVVFHDGRRCQG